MVAHRSFGPKEKYTIGILEKRKEELLLAKLNESSGNLTQE